MTADTFDSVVLMNASPQRWIKTYTEVATISIDCVTDDYTELVSLHERTDR
jgi:hypothetical protein